MHVEVPGLPPDLLLSGAKEEESATVRERVLVAHARQKERQRFLNHALAGQQLTKHCPMQDKASALLTKLAERFNLSARVCHRIIRVARTIADMAVSDILTDAHIGEAFAYRCFHRFIPPSEN
jgi:magnesium chelatase family protein